MTKGRRQDHAKEQQAPEARTENDAARAARFRRLVDALAPSTARDALIAGMVERARDLLERGEAAAADALLEFVPEWRARAMLDDFFDELI